MQAKIKTVIDRPQTIVTSICMALGLILFIIFGSFAFATVQSRSQVAGTNQHISDAFPGIPFAGASQPLVNTEASAKSYAVAVHNTAPIAESVVTSKDQSKTSNTDVKKSNPPVEQVNHQIKNKK